MKDWSHRMSAAEYEELARKVEEMRKEVNPRWTADDAIYFLAWIGAITVMHFLDNIFRWFVGVLGGSK